MRYVIALDVGIRNMGMYVYDFTCNKIVYWDNVPLMTGRYVPMNNVQYVRQFLVVLYALHAVRVRARLALAIRQPREADAAEPADSCRPPAYMDGTHQDTFTIRSRYMHDTCMIRGIRILITTPPKFDNKPPVTHQPARQRDDRSCGQLGVPVLYCSTVRNDFPRAFANLHTSLIDSYLSNLSREVTFSLLTVFPPIKKALC
jgi:hypothetical protein